MDSLIDDLRFAKQVAVRLYLISGEEVFAGVHEVGEDFVSLFAPETFGDETTTRKVPFDVITSVTVTDVSW